MNVATRDQLERFALRVEDAMHRLPR
ncbi:hypothetical protein THICB2_370019 [Thiomonas sp. CB2]|nr:hypothetical protein THICB2_370019 [Thiomonas sp. CB2]